MPLARIYIAADALWGIWRIEEDEATLASALPGESIPPGLTNPLKRLEHLAARRLLMRLLEEWNIAYPGLTKDEHGKPFLRDSPIHISLSHSYPFVAAVLHRSYNVGIDLEQPKPKLLRVGPRVLAPTELLDAGDDVIKHCIYWCAKESLVKIHGKKGLIFCDNLYIDPFERETEGTLTGRIIIDDHETAVPLSYLVTENFVMVVSAPDAAP